jgi:Trypsin-co-occurring domain 2
VVGFRRTRQVAAQRIELAQVISQLREELDTARRAGQGEDLRFEVGPVELELMVGVDREAGPNAKVNFWVIELGASGKVASQASQRIKLILDPRESSGQNKDQRPWISGAEQPGER